MRLEVCVWMFVTFRILRFVLRILRYAGYEISNLSDSMLILYYFAAPAADLLVCSKGHEHATWGMHLDVRYFPYPKIFFRILRYAGYGISNLCDLMLILYYFAAHGPH